MHAARSVPGGSTWAVRVLSSATPVCSTRVAVSPAHSRECYTEPDEEHDAATSTLFDDVVFLHSVAQTHTHTHTHKQRYPSLPDKPRGLRSYCSVCIHCSCLSCDWVPA
jgi:hypothetical protein